MIDEGFLEVGSTPYRAVTDALAPRLEEVVAAAASEALIVGELSEEEALLACTPELDLAGVLDPFWFPINGLRDAAIREVALAAALRWHRHRGALVDPGDGEGERVMGHLALAQRLSGACGRVLAVRLREAGRPGEHRLGLARVGDAVLHDVVDERRGDRRLSVVPVALAASQLLGLLGPLASPAHPAPAVEGDDAEALAGEVDRLDALATHVAEVRACARPGAVPGPLLLRTWTTPDGLALLERRGSGWRLGGADDDVLRTRIGALLGRER